MKMNFTVREKVLMAILGVLIVFCVYYFVFLIPVTQQMNAYVEENYAVEDQIIFAEAKVAKMKQMEAELAKILSSDSEDIVALPEYDNNQNVMNSLYMILSKTNQYNVNFADVTEEEHTVRRNVVLEYECSDYETAKEVLKQIHDGAYRCLLKDFYLSAEEEGYRIVIDITYFEYK